MDWDSENYEPPSVANTAAAATLNKWDGEEEEDNIKDSWEDEEDEKRKQEQSKKKDQTKKPKTKLELRIEERERRENERLCGRVKEIQEELAFEVDTSDMTPDEIKEHNARRKKLQDELEVELAKEMLGVPDDDVSLDGLRPQTKEEFSALGDAIYSKLSIYKDSDHFPQLVDDLILKLCVIISSSDLKKLKISIDNLFVEKLKLEKAQEKTKKVKGKGKARLRIEGESKYDEFSAYTVDDYDDFM